MDHPHSQERQRARRPYKAKELEKWLFTMGDLRRTVETLLAAEGVGTDMRARLQSHGLGGAHARQYDRHDYIVEKRNALETLHRLLTGLPATVHRSSAGTHVRCPVPGDIPS